MRPKTVSKTENKQLKQLIDPIFPFVAKRKVSMETLKSAQTIHDRQGITKEEFARIADYLKPLHESLVKIMEKAKTLTIEEKKP